MFSKSILFKQISACYSQKTTSAPSLVTDSVKRTQIKRGLEEFFELGGSWNWKKDELLTGRPWQCGQLRQKSFEDLRKLWWISLKEINKLTSQKLDASRVNLEFPHKGRVRAVKDTMSHIKMVLIHRIFLTFLSSYL